jgi:hypothetical protein
MKTYGHFRDEHGISQAQMVSFAPAEAAAARADAAPAKKFAADKGVGGNLLEKPGFRFPNAFAASRPTFETGRLESGLARASSTCMSCTSISNAHVFHPCHLASRKVS